MGDLPTPKFSRGDTIWTAEIDQTAANWPCPDCLGSHQWTITTPAGGVMTTGCLRCSNKWRSSELPSLSFVTYAGRARGHTVDGITVTDAADHWHDAVEYRCNSSANSRQTLRERDVFSTEAEALADAQARAATKGAEVLATPIMVTAKHLADLPFTDARFSEFKNGLWESWWGYRSLLETCRGLIDDPPTSAKDWKEAVVDVIRWERSGRDVTPMEKLVRACEALGADAPAEILAALAQMKPAARKALNVDKVADFEVEGLADE